MGPEKWPDANGARPARAVRGVSELGNVCDLMTSSKSAGQTRKFWTVDYNEAPMIAKTLDHFYAAVCSVAWTKESGGTSRPGRIAVMPSTGGVGKQLTPLLK